MISELKIIDLQLLVHLGCTKEERANPQSISVDIFFSFVDTPKGAFTDLLADSLCYYRAVKLVEEIACYQEYNLVEALSIKLHQGLIEYCTVNGYQNVTIKVVVTKLYPPVSNLMGGVSFAYSN